MMQYLYLEIKKILHFPTFKYGLFFLLGILTLINILFLGQKGQEITSGWGSIFSDSVGVMLFITNVILITISAQFVVTDYNSRTAQMVIATGTMRVWFILAKSISLVIGAYLLVFIGVTFSLILSGIVALLHQNFDVSQINFLYVLLSLVLAPLRFLPFMFLTFFLTTVFRAAVFPLASVLFYYLLGEHLLNYVISPKLQVLVNILPGNIAASIDMISVSQMSQVNLFPVINTTTQVVKAAPAIPFDSFLFIGIYCVIFISLSYFVFSRQNLSK